jgi:two-component system, cell cycle sensor histidine kinase and response regulator CckA
VGTFAWNPITGEAEWSEELHRICGVPLDVPGTPELYFSMVHPDDRERIATAAATVSPGEPIGPWEYRVVRPDGRIVEVYAEAMPTFDHHGNPTGYIGTVLDVSMRKRFEAQLLQAQKMEALGRLAGGVAHDFNNLLTIIGAHAGRLRRRLEDPSLAEIVRAVERAGQLTHQLLAFGRQAVLEHRELDPVPAARESIRMVERVIDESVKLELNTDGCQGKIATDAAQLEQVLLNLVINARDALDGGGTIRVTLSDEHVEQAPLDVQPAILPGDYVVLAVEDDGVGMPDAVRHRALEPFFTTKEPGRGTGLGLAMVYGIASQYAGGIVLDSRPGGGTTVRVYFPRVTAAAPAAEGERPAVARRGAGEALLVVDDDPAVRTILRDVLEDAGYSAHVATCGEEALALFDAEGGAFVAVVTDVFMPGIGGIDLVKALRERAPSLPALYLSGYAPFDRADDDPRVRGAFLRKPFTPEALVARIGELLAESAHDA